MWLPCPYKRWLRMAGSCYCDSELSFADCCEPYLRELADPPTPVALMRSRYCAFATGNVEYLLATWDEAFRPNKLTIDPEQKWIGLKVLDHGEHEPGKLGWVHFVARYKAAGKGYRVEERSLFLVRKGRWYYQQPDLSQES